LQRAQRVNAHRTKEIAMTRLLEISTAAGPDVFVVQRFTGREELGRPYEYHLELVSER
jgi:uncharacterized protein involved in type VI secretion and phage assembly